MSITIAKLIKMLSEQPDQTKRVCVSEAGVTSREILGILEPENLEHNVSNDFIVIVGEGLRFPNSDGRVG